MAAGKLLDAGAWPRPEAKVASCRIMLFYAFLSRPLRTMAVILHGIKNCDSVKKARQWLQAQKIDYEFRDFRERPPSMDEIESWMQHCDWQKLLNKRSTSWKNLSSAERERAIDASAVAPLLHANPTLIKRPLLTMDDSVTAGFSNTHYQSLFAN
jgi:Spx/MgsR family transcriptional regulator